MEFPEAVDWSKVDELVFWLHAEEAIGKKAGRYIIFDVEEQSNFGWGFYLFDNEGHFKGIPFVKINWTGWNRVAIPLRSPGRDVHSAWDDEKSLRNVEKIRFDLETIEPPEFRGQGGSLYISDVRTVSKDIPPFAYLAVVLVTLPLIGFLFLVARSTGIAGSGLWMAGAAILARSALAIATPLSSDFISSFYMGMPVLPSSNPLDSPLFEGGPFYFLLQRGLYHLWSIMPVDHPDLLSIFPGYWSYPALHGRLWWERNEFFYFLGTPGSLLLTYMLKFPNLVFDIGSSLLIYTIVSLVTASRARSLLAMGLWLFNPVTLIVTTMWAPVDPAWVFFALLSIFLLMRRRVFESGASLGMAIATRMAPLLLLPVFLALLIRPRDEARTSRLLQFAAPALLLPLLGVMPTLLAGGRLEHIPGIGEPYFLFGPILQFFDSQIAVGVASVFVYYMTLYHIIERSDNLNSQLTDVTPFAILGLLVTVFAFSKFQFHLLLWILPFLILDAVTGRRSPIYAGLFALSAVVTVSLITGPYFSTFGRSVFFVPNLAPWMNTASQALFRVGIVPSGFEVKTIVMLSRSVLAGVSIVYAATILLGIHRELQKHPGVPT